MSAKNSNRIHIFNVLNNRELKPRQISKITGIGFATVEKELSFLKKKKKITSEIKKEISFYSRKD